MKAKMGKTDEEGMTIGKLLCEFSDVFSINDTDLGLTHLAEHSIDTGDSRPIKQAPRRVPSAHVHAHEEEQVILQLQ